MSIVPHDAGAETRVVPRLWDVALANKAFKVTFSLSLLAHVLWLNPFSWPRSTKFNEIEGEADIVVDLFEEAQEPAPNSVENQTPASDFADAAVAVRDGGASDAALWGDAASDADAALDGAREGKRDGAPDATPPDAANDASDAGDAGDAAPPAPLPDKGPKNASEFVGAAGKIQVAENYVVVSINGEVIRTNPVARRTGPLLQGLAQWNQFLGGTGFNPVLHTDWVLISGPSLTDTTRDIFTIRYNVPDTTVDAACEHLARRYKDKGGRFDSGVPGVKTWRTFADKGERILVRPQHGILVILPSREILRKDTKQSDAEAEAKEKALIAKVAKVGYPSKLKNSKEAMRLMLRYPSKPFPFLPEQLDVIRMWVTPGEEDGGTISAEGDCETELACKDAYEAMEANLATMAIGASLGSLFKSIPRAIGDILANARLNRNGKHVNLTVDVTRPQLEALLQFVARDVVHVKVP